MVDKSEPLPPWPTAGKTMTEEAFHELERLSPDHKYEYIGGRAWMMGGGSVAHDRIAYNVRFVLDMHFRSGPCTVFGAGVQVLMGVKKGGQRHFVYPDATVSCDVTDRAPDNTLIESPHVVIEVLSPGMKAKERGIKFNLYQKCSSIQEIVLVNQFAQYIEVWERDKQDENKWNYRHYNPHEIVELHSIDVRVEIGDLYRGLDFPDPIEEND